MHPTRLNIKLYDKRQGLNYSILYHLFRCRNILVYLQCRSWGDISGTFLSVLLRLI